MLSRNSEAFYDDLFDDEVFKTQFPSQSLETVDLQGKDGANKKKTLALGTSIAGIVMLLSLIAGFFIMRRRQDRHQLEGVGDEEAPPAVCSLEGGCGGECCAFNLLV